MKCPHCNQEHPDGFLFCPVTGQKLDALKACNNPECSNYGKHILPLDSRFCPDCGCKLDEQSTKATCSKEVEIVQIPSMYRPRKRFSEGLMLVENQEHKFGYLNDSLEEVIPCQYCNGDKFVNGVAPVYNNERWGAIDIRGNIVHPFQYGNMYSIPNYKSVSRPKNEPFFIKDSKVIDKWNNEYNFYHGIPILANNNDIYYLDQGVITCYTLERDLKGIWHQTIKFKKEGFTKRNGFRKDGVHQFYNNLAIIRKNEKDGIFNLLLDEIVPCEFEKIYDFDLDSENTVACDSKGDFYHIKINKK